MSNAKPRFSVPHPLVLLAGCVLLAAAASYVLPAGRFDRTDDAATGRSVVVAGTYHAVERTPVNFFDAIVALPRGMAEAADVIFLVFLIGGAFTVVDETGALRRGVMSLVRALGGRDLLVIPIVSVLLILTRTVGFTPLVAVAMSAGAALVGSAFSPINPFQVQIAQNLAGLPLGSGGLFRSVFLILALALWIGMTMRYAARERQEPEVFEDSGDAGISGKDWVIFGLIATTFAVLITGLTRWDWDFNRMSAAFFIMGVIVGLLAGMGLSGTADAYVRGFRSMAYAALLIGFASAISVVLEDGQIIDTIVNAMFTPLEGLPLIASSLGMIVAQTAIHVPVPSVSGQAVLTMPVLIPLSDLLGLSRQVVVLAYQYGAGLCDLMTPTNGALLAILAAAGVRYEDWVKFAMPLYLALVALGAVSIAIAIAIGLA
jgi:uncharacterized ion transporter superfamily protein YfcC